MQQVRMSYLPIPPSVQTVEQLDRPTARAGHVVAQHCNDKGLECLGHLGKTNAAFVGLVHLQQVEEVNLKGIHATTHSDLERCGKRQASGRVQLISKVGWVGSGTHPVRTAK